MDILNKRDKEIYDRRKASGSKIQKIQRYLFLDIVGVLKTIRYSYYLTDHDEDKRDEFGDIFDPEAVANLAYIIERVPDVKIIISSSWRFKGWDWMNRMWEQRKIPGKLFSMTPALEKTVFVDFTNLTKSEFIPPHGNKGMEVDEWLRLNVKRGTKYLLAILGDEFFYNNSQNTFMVNIRPYDGITKDDANKVLELLRWKYEEEMKEKVINLNKPQVQIMGPLHLDAVIYEDGRTSLKRLGKPKK